MITRKLILDLLENKDNNRVRWVSDQHILNFIENHKTEYEFDLDSYRQELRLSCAKNFINYQELADSYKQSLIDVVTKLCPTTLLWVWLESKDLLTFKTLEQLKDLLYTLDFQFDAPEPSHMDTNGVTEDDLKDVLEASRENDK